jgi:hypothetical protein
MRLLFVVQLPVKLYFPCGRLAQDPSIMPPLFTCTTEGASADWAYMWVSCAVLCGLVRLMVTMLCLLPAHIFLPRRAGDSACHFSSFSANGTLTGRLALTGERDGYAAAVDQAEGEGLGGTEQGQCSPRDRGGLGRMTRIGQVTEEHD